MNVSDEQTTHGIGPDDGCTNAAFTDAITVEHNSPSSLSTGTSNPRGASENEGGTFLPRSSNCGIMTPNSVLGNKGDGAHITDMPGQKSVSRRASIVSGSSRITTMDVNEEMQKQKRRITDEHVYKFSRPGITSARYLTKHRSKRLIYKRGECNVIQKNIHERSKRFLKDIFTTLVDVRWRWTILIFILAFWVSWIFFAQIWWFLAFIHGDTTTVLSGDDHHPEEATPCVRNVYDFTTALLFSVETQHTIGFGNRHITTDCVEAVALLIVQSCTGIIILALMTGLVFAKLSRSKKRAGTLMFSKTAVICTRDNELCLLFRVGDMRKSHMVGASIRALVIKKRVTLEGEVMPLYKYDVPLSCKNGMFLVWPMVVEHKINSKSPFWDMTPEEFERGPYELIIILEGIGESTGSTTQARTSYLPGEIIWGHRFERLVTFKKERGGYRVDHSNFHATVPVKVPRMSAKMMAQIQENLDIYPNEEGTCPEPVSTIDSQPQFEPESNEHLARRNTVAS